MTRLVGLALAVLSACSAGTDPVPPPADIAHRVEAGGHAASVLAAVEALVARPELAAGDAWQPFDDWAIRANWLRFYRDWNTGGSGEFGAPERAVEVVATYARLLEERGVEFILAPIPTRLQIYPDRLPGVDPIDDFAGADLAQARFLDGVARAGVEVADLFTAFLAARHDAAENSDRLLFHDYDHHWTPRGVALAADLVAERVRGRAWFTPGPARAGVDFELRRERQMCALRGPASDDYAREVELWLERVLTPEGKPAHKKDRASPILLLTDSYGKFYRSLGGDFANLLYARLGMRIDVIAIDGGGAVGVWEALARREGALAGKRLVIWLCGTRAFAAPELAVVEPGR